MRALVEENPGGGTLGQCHMGVMGVEVVFVAVVVAVEVVFMGVVGVLVIGLAVVFVVFVVAVEVNIMGVVLQPV